MADPAEIEKLVVEALQTIYDPEIPVNIHELGLIYGIAVDPSGAVTVRMTLTAAGCPAAQALPREVEERVRAVPGVSDVQVDLVFDPPWDRSRMSEAARLQLGVFCRQSAVPRLRRCPGRSHAVRGASRSWNGDAGPLTQPSPLRKQGARSGARGLGATGRPRRPRGR